MEIRGTFLATREGITGPVLVVFITSRGSCYGTRTHTHTYIYIWWDIREMGDR